MNEALELAVWVIFPYVMLASFVGGHIWRYRYDKFGWTSRSSQLHESRLLRWASPMFHFGILIVLFGHFVGLVIPASVTHALGIGGDAYHAVAVTSGWVAGTATVVGLTLLIYRRRTTGAVLYSTTPMDKFMYLVFGGVVLLGMASLVGTTLDLNHHYDYREGVSVWFRSLFMLSPESALMFEAPLMMQLHAIAGFFLIGLWPYTRLVHVFSVPVWYVFRPYVVFRSRRTRSIGAVPVRRGWESVEDSPALIKGRSRKP